MQEALKRFSPRNPWDKKLTAFCHTNDAQGNSSIDAVARKEIALLRAEIKNLKEGKDQTDQYHNLIKKDIAKIRSVLAKHQQSIDALNSQMQQTTKLINSLNCNLDIQEIGGTEVYGGDESDISEMEFHSQGDGENATSEIEKACKTAKYGGKKAINLKPEYITHQTSWPDKNSYHQTSEDGSPTHLRNSRPAKPRDVPRGVEWERKGDPYPTYSTKIKKAKSKLTRQ